MNHLILGILLTSFFLLGCTQRQITVWQRGVNNPDGSETVTIGEKHLELKYFLLNDLGKTISTNLQFEVIDSRSSKKNPQANYYVLKDIESEIFTVLPFFKTHSIDSTKFDFRTMEVMSNYAFLTLQKLDSMLQSEVKTPTINTIEQATFVSGFAGPKFYRLKMVE